MKRSHVFLGVGALILLLAAGGAFVFQTQNSGPTPVTTTAPRPDQEPDTVVVQVNGQAITAPMLEQVYAHLLSNYRQKYAQNGNGEDFDQQLEGPEGAYYRLQIHHQAANQLIQRQLLIDEVAKLGIQVDDQQVAAEATRRFRTFLDENNLSEQELEAVLSDPQKRQIARQFFGIFDKSVGAMQARLYQEVEAEQLTQKLTTSVLGNLSPTSEAGQQALSRWLADLRAQSTVVFEDPLLNAFELESQVSQGETLQDRQARLEKAIAAYERIKDEQLSNDPYLDFYLGRLYNLKVNWSLAQERELVEKAEKNQQAQQALEQLQEEIARTRTLATHSINAFGVDNNNREQLELLVQSDPGNPYYYYLYAKFLLEQWKEQGITQPIRILWGALSRDPEYVDALMLMGDINMIREFYQDAVKNYTEARTQYAAIIDTEDAYKANDNPLETIERKLAEAHLALASQTEQAPQLYDDPAQAREDALVQAQQLLNGLQARLNDTHADYPFVLSDLGDLFVLKQDYAQAERYYQASLDLVIDKVVYQKLGHAYYLAEDLKKAQQSFEKSLEIDKGYAKAHLGLAKVFQKQGQVKTAQDEYLKAFTFGVDLTYTERRQIALDALALDGSNEAMRFALSDMYMERNVYAGAVKQFEAILEHNPEAYKAYIGLGKVAQGRLQYQEAIDYFNQALALADSPQKKITAYDLIYQTSRSLAGPGKPVNEEGQNALLKLALLYLDNGQLTNSWQSLQLLKTRYADFQPEVVKAAETTLTQVVGDNLPGRPVRDLGNTIIAPGEAHPDYNSTPPTSGWHYTVPTHWGIHNDPIPDEIQLSNLAAGGVLIQYRPELAPDTVQRLIDAVKTLRSQRRYCRLMLAPYVGLDAPIVLTAWNRIVEFEEFSLDAVRAFVDTFIEKGPDVSNVSCQ